MPTHTHTHTIQPRDIQREMKFMLLAGKYLGLEKKKHKNKLAIITQKKRTRIANVCVCGGGYTITVPLIYVKMS